MSGINAEHLVFLDESGINTNLTRLYAHALHWKRAVDAAPLNTPTATTVLSSIRLDGTTIFTTYQTDICKIPGGSHGAYDSKKPVSP